MSRIINVTAREIFDSRGNPTVQAEATLDDGSVGVASVPSGASTGRREVAELRDGDRNRFSGKGVLKAVANVNGPIRDALAGLDADDQAAVDSALVELDGTPSKSRLGANAILGASLAVLRASAAAQGAPLYERIGRLAGIAEPAELPVPMFNILNGGAHAAGSTDFQEFMVVPVGLPAFPDALRAGVEVYHRLRDMLHDAGRPTTVGDEGGFAPPGLTTRQALDYIVRAIESAGYEPGAQVALALDPAASEFYDSDAGEYRLAREGRTVSSRELTELYADLVREYPIVSIEDGLSEDDWDGWRVLTRDLGANIQVVGDDLFATQLRYVRQGIKQASANAVLVKLNQVGTVSETLATIALARKEGWGIVISHRSGETEDTSIADLAVGVRAGQIKTGAPARSERLAKYNRLLRIAESLGDRATYAGRRVLRRRPPG